MTDAQHSLDWHQTRTAAETVPCPYCRAPAGRTCRNRYTGLKVSFPAHPDRIKLSADRTTRTQIGRAAPQINAQPLKDATAPHTPETPQP